MLKLPEEIKIVKVRGTHYDKYKIEYELNGVKHDFSTTRLDLEEVCDLLITNIWDKRR